MYHGCNENQTSTNAEIFTSRTGTIVLKSPSKDFPFVKKGITLYGSTDFILFTFRILNPLRNEYYFAFFSAALKAALLAFRLAYYLSEWSKVTPLIVTPSTLLAKSISFPI